MEGGIDLEPYLEQLDENLDDLEQVLEPLLLHILASTTKNLPVLDQAKVYVLLTYTIESLLFSYLSLHGVKAKEHAVYRELTRTKQYFEKISAAESEPTKRENLTLNKAAAARIIKHGLSGNEEYDLKRAEAEARQKALAHLKLEALDITKPEAETNYPAEEEVPDTRNSDIDDSSSYIQDTSIGVNFDPDQILQPHAMPPDNASSLVRQRSSVEAVNIPLSKARRRQINQQAKEEGLSSDDTKRHEAKIIGGKVQKKRLKKNKPSKKSRS